MLYKSTRGLIEKVSFQEVLFSGLAPDGGLYIPEFLPGPKTFNVNKSRLFLILIMNHMLERKITNGKIFIIILGMKILVSISGINILTFRFLKNSISSNKFNITPKQ